ncbi:hypothetical protein KAFR_0A06300 [Kazachstania africana CBS 2517]|uniref:Uncharacterized protein n=1 Tax=Kazachstania africana (strain ATCC 22294 / BCRC 22015 / CBS 2517 / CECT 1963 / NBRC 1671 / NRRL Y-8276) TaxID=1071382 RepID=H2ANW5_KAZAF|nr:hypothetical protein KAFR_0A06300 [Kazachstania africana CBS 2517]CCF56065.1 hypothetical protein KAFR_0A06300 [Kazachstania africana CBS 2517]
MPSDTSSISLNPRRKARKSLYTEEVPSTSNQRHLAINNRHTQLANERDTLDEAFFAVYIDDTRFDASPGRYSLNSEYDNNDDDDGSMSITDEGNTTNSIRQAQRDNDMHSSMNSSTSSQATQETNVLEREIINSDVLLKDSSTRTVSTSKLVSSTIESGTDELLSTRDLTNFIPGGFTSSLMESETHRLLRSKVSSEGSSMYYSDLGKERTHSTLFQYDDTIEPDVREAVKLLKNDMTSKEKNLRYITDAGTDIGGFKPHGYNILRKVSSESNKSGGSSVSKGSISPNSPSLISNLFVSTPKTNKYGALQRDASRVQDQDNIPKIPVLIKVSGSHSWKEKHNDVFPIEPETPEEDKRISPSKPRKSYGSFKRFSKFITQANIPSDNVSDANRGSIQHDLDLERNSEHIPIQRLNSESMHSFDSGNYAFTEVYSVWRIVLTLMCCLLCPPFFFMIGIGARGGVNDYRLLKLILNKEHRIGLLKGFIWDVDVMWFRALCLLLGIGEILAIAAGISVGFAVGLTRQSSLVLT